MQVPIDQVRENGHDPRHVPASIAADAALADSIRSCGVLQSLLVHDAPDGNGYLVVDGRRRLRCARAAGLTEVPVEVQSLDGEQAIIASAAANMVRLSLHPLDTWRAVREMIDFGRTPADAARALGLNERQARVMDKLANLHPDMLKLIERCGSIPEDRILRVIANAPAKVQAKAAKLKTAVFHRPDGTIGVQWWEIERACATERIPQPRAIFDVSLMQWEEDLFAQPDDPERFTTTDKAKFCALQQAALEEQVAAAHAKKKRVQLGEFDPRTNSIPLPKGWTRIYGGNFEKPKRHQHVFRAVDGEGRVVDVLAEDTKAARAAEREKAKKALAGQAADDSDDDDSPDPRPGITLAPKEPKPGITQAGMKTIAEAKTQALHARLADQAEDMRTVDMLRLMILAFAARNVEVQGVSYADQKERVAIIGLLLYPGGNLAEMQEAEVRKTAAAVLIRVLTVGAPGIWRSSGPAAEWIGAAIAADMALPRFDTEDFLKTCSGDVIRAAAADIGMKNTGAVGALRQQLVGKLPNWHPAAADFGAPAPTAEETTNLADTSDDDEADARMEDAA